MRKCTNCLHCKTNIINESECCLGHEINTTECSAFAPKNEYIEEYLQQDKREKVVPSVLTWAGVGSIAFSIYFCCLGWLEGSWGNPYLWTLLVIGIICLAVAGIMPLALRLRRESLKQEVRKELENEVRSDVAPKMLTRNIIKDYLEQQSLSPEPIDGNEGFKFISHDTYFKLFYDGDYSLTIRYGCELEENDVKIFLIVTREKFWVALEGFMNCPKKMEVLLMRLFVMLTFLLSMLITSSAYFRVIYIV